MIEVRSRFGQRNPSIPVSYPERYGQYSVQMWLVSDVESLEADYKPMYIERGAFNAAYRDRVELTSGDYPVPAGSRGEVVGFNLQRCDSTDQRVVTVKFTCHPEPVGVHLKDIKVNHRDLEQFHNITH